MLSDSSSSSIGSKTSFLRDFIRPWLLKQVEYDTMHRVIPFQAACGLDEPVTSETDVKNKKFELWQDSSQNMLKRGLYLLLSLYFHAGVWLGDELFYMTGFPILIWNVDIELARKVILTWMLAMYFGQGLKDRFKLPRPTHVSKRVKYWDATVDCEYGFPSTHVMAVTIECCMILYVTWTKNVDHSYPVWHALSLSALVIVSMCCGRVYYGVHSFVDTIGGLLLSLSIFFFSLSILTPVDDWLLSTPSSAFLFSIFTSMLLLLYPKPSYFSTVFVDTAIVMGAGNGVGSAVYFAAWMDFAMVPLPWADVPFWQLWLPLAVFRTVCGMLLVFAVRAVGKAVVPKVIAWVLPKSQVPDAKRYAAVIPAKFIVYSMVGFSMYAIAPIMLRHPLFHPALRVIV